MNTAPYIHCGQSTALQMLDAAIALLPAAAGAVWFFGLRAAAMLLLAVAAAAATQFLWDRFTGRQELRTLTVLVTGLLSALLLPARAALWAAPLGAVIAVSVKVLTGGIGQNLVDAVEYPVIPFHSSTCKDWPFVCSLPVCEPFVQELCSIDIQKNEVPSDGLVLLYDDIACFQSSTNMKQG